MHVLVVDDDRNAAILLAELLKHDTAMSITADVAFGGAQAIELALRGPERPDVVILDIRMPDMSGFEVAMAIRKAMGSHAPLLIAVSGQVGRADPIAAANGFDHALPKPVDFARLLDLLHRRAR